MVAGQIVPVPPTTRLLPPSTLFKEDSEMASNERNWYNKMERYSTWEEAEKGHAEMVRKVSGG